MEGCYVVLLLAAAGFISPSAARTLVEYRIPLPFDVDEYEVGQRLSTLLFELGETGGGEGVEIVINEPRDGLRYTHKIWHLESKVPSIIRKLAPTGALSIHSKSWNNYPDVTTEDTNDYMKDKFKLIVRSRYVTGDCDAENIFELNSSDLAERYVDVVDIVSDKLDSRDYTSSSDPTSCTSRKTNIAPLDGNWRESQVKMCAYKLVDDTIEWRGLQNILESRVKKATRRYMQAFHRRSFCWRDEWSGMSMDELLAEEKEGKKELDQMRYHESEVKGMMENKRRLEELIELNLIYKLLN